MGSFAILSLLHGYGVRSLSTRGHPPCLRRTVFHGGQLAGRVAISSRLEDVNETSWPHFRVGVLLSRLTWRVWTTDQPADGSGLERGMDTRG